MLQGPCTAPEGMCCCCDRGYGSSMVIEPVRGKLAPRNLAINRLDEGCSDRTMAAPDGSGVSPCPDPAPGLSARRTRTGRTGPCTRAYEGFRGVTKSFARGIDSRPAPSYLHFTRTGSMIEIQPIPFSGFIESVRLPRKEFP